MAKEPPILAASFRVIHGIAGKWNLECKATFWEPLPEWGSPCCSVPDGWIDVSLIGRGPRQSDTDQWMLGSNVFIATGAHFPHISSCVPCFITPCGCYGHCSGASAGHTHTPVDEAENRDDKMLRTPAYIWKSEVLEGGNSLMEKRSFKVQPVFHSVWVAVASTRTKWCSKQIQCPPEWLAPLVNMSKTGYTKNVFAVYPPHWCIFYHRPFHKLCVCEHSLHRSRIATVLFSCETYC